VLSVAMINAGYAHDIIPDSATFGGTYRAFSKKSFYGLRKRIEEVNIWLCPFHIVLSKCCELISSMTTKYWLT